MVVVMDSVEEEKETVILIATVLATFSVGAITVLVSHLMVEMTAAMKDQSAMEKMTVVMDSVEKVRETVTGTVTVQAFWFVGRGTVLARGLRIMMIAVRNLRESHTMN